MGTLIIMSGVYKPDPGGIEEWTYQVASALHRSGRHVVVVAPRAGPEASVFDQRQPFETIRLLPTRDRTLPGLARYIWRYSLFLPVFRRLLDQRHVEYILAVDVGLYAGPKGPWVWLAASSRDVKKGVVFHGLDLESIRSSSRLAQGWFNLIVPRLNNIFCNSRFTAGLCSSIWGSSVKPIIAGCGICVESLPAQESRVDARSRLGIGSRHVLLTVACLVPRKGIDMVIRCLPKIMSHFPDVTYLVGGAGPDIERLKRLASDAGCARHVRFDGVLAPERLGAYYSAADVFVMPSRHIPGRSVEGFGIVFAEAAFYGLPVVGGATGGVPDAVIDQQTGLLVNPTDENEIAQAILRLLRDPELRENLGAAGRRRAIQHLTWDCVTARLLAAIESSSAAR